MRLRIALKIFRSTREGAYSEGKFEAALRRIERCKSTKAENAYWQEMVRKIPKEDRAQMAYEGGWSDIAFRIMME